MTYYSIGTWEYPHRRLYTIYSKMKGVQHETTMFPRPAWGLLFVSQCWRNCPWSVKEHLGAFDARLIGPRPVCLSGGIPPTVTLPAKCFNSGPTVDPPCRGSRNRL